MYSRKLLLVLSLLASDLAMQAQRYNCHTKQSFLSTLSSTCHKFQHRSNLTPIRIDWYQNSKRIKSTKAIYKKDYTSFIKDTIILGNNKRNSFAPYFFNQYDSAWLYYSMSRLGHTVQNLVHPFYITSKDSVFSSYPNLIDITENYLNTNLHIDFQNINYHHINDLIHPIARTYSSGIVNGLPPNLGDTVIRVPRQLIVNNNLLYVLDLNYEVQEYHIDSLKIKHQPKIAIFDYEQRKYIGQLPPMHTGYSDRLALPCTKYECLFMNHLRYNNFDIMNNKLYLNYSYKMRDSLAVFDLDANKWIHTMALPIDSFIYHDSIFIKAGFNIYYAQYGSVAGKSNIRLDKDANIIVAEYRGNIYKISNDLKSIDTIYHLKDSSRGGYYYPDFTTKKFEIDGWGNMILPDIKSKNIKRYDKQEGRFSVLIDSLYLGCVNLYPDKPSLKLFSPYNIQADCSGNLYTEYFRILDTTDYTSDMTCESKYFLKFQAYIDDTLDFNLGVSDTLSVKAYFYDGDSTEVFVTYPFEKREKDSIVCNKFSFKNRTYSNSLKLYDTFHGLNCIDTLLELNFIVFKDTSIFQKLYSCTSLILNARTYNQSRLDTFSYKSKYGCDSIMIWDISIGLNNKVNLENGIHYTALQDSVSYQWYRCQPWRRIVNETKRTFTTKTKGSYAVVLDNGKGCRDTSECIELYSNQVSGTSGQQVWSVYPNPFIDELTIDLGKTCKSISVKLYDLTGRIVFQQQHLKLTSLNFRIPNAPKGIYFLQVETESQNHYFNIRKD